MRRLSSSLFCLALASCSGASVGSSNPESSNPELSDSDLSSSDNAAPNDAADSSSLTTVAATSPEPPASEEPDSAEPTTEPTTDETIEDNICESPDLQVVLARPELGPNGRRLSLSRDVRALQIRDGVRYEISGQTVHNAEVKHLFDDEDGAHYVWRHLIGALHDQYRMHIPEQNQANIDETAVVEVQYVHTNAGEIIFETPEAQIIAKYQALNDAVIGDAHNDLPGLGLLYTTFGFSVLEPTDAPQHRFDEITIFHGIGHEVRTNPDGSCETDWFNPFARDSHSLETEVEVERNETIVYAGWFVALTPDQAEVFESSFDTPVHQGWLRRWRRADHTTGVLLTSGRSISLLGDDDIRHTIDVGVSDDGPVE